ncbi:hypothetical protein VM1G_05976 [Cytospora mali]|uniref:Uncharacterized protein n=1 Tax=Cytospora mali TaxID=578113 RepID=A0A194W2N2_CYTMA|nr:hypothetical protein VM1G_05976 [Valsa mali]
MAASGDSKKDVGSSFAEASHPTTTPTIDHPLDDVVPSLTSSSSEPSPQVITPRPHLFSSLEEAHSQITSRSREGSRQVSGETRNSGIGDESFLMSLSPTDARTLYTNIGFPITRAFGRSLTDTVPSQLPLSQDARELNDGNLNVAQALASQVSSRTEPLVRPSSTVRYIEARNFAESDISNQPPPYTSGNTVDRIIHQYGSSAQASSAEQSQAGVYEYSDESDCFIGQYDGGIKSSIGTRHFAENDPCPPPLFNNSKQNRWGAYQSAQATSRSATEPSAESKTKRLNTIGYDRNGAIVNKTAPDVPLPENPPFHPSNPFATTAARSGIVAPAPRIDDSPSSRSSSPPRPLLYYSDSEDDYARIGSDLGVKDEDEAEAENRLSILQPPPERMHSARRHERGRRSLVRNLQTSDSGTTTGESDNNDPFKYDAIFPRSSKEREVSVCLQKVSEIEQDGDVIPCSPGRGPLRSTGNYFNCEAASPTGQKLLNNTWSASMSPVQGLDRNARMQHHGSTSQGSDFFDPNAINPKWALGSPDAVRVPVRQNSFPDEEINLEEAHTYGQKAVQQLVLEDLRRVEGQNCPGSMIGAGLNYDMGFSTNGFKQCGSSIANYSDCDIPTEAASIRPNNGHTLPEGTHNNHQQQGIGPFATRPRLVHPPGNNNNPQDTRYRRHNVYQAPVPVFVPEQRNHRVNGLFQNSSRPVPEAASDAETINGQDQKRSPSFGQKVSDAIRQPFRRGSIKRPPLHISTLHERQLPRHPFTELGSEDGIENREHSIELTTIAAQPNLKDQVHRPRTRQTETLVAAVLSPPSTMPRVHFDNRNRGYSLESTASASLLDSNQFDLIPLDVAQRRQAQRRASGQEDQTLTGRERLNMMRNASYGTNASQAGSQPVTPSSAMTASTGKVTRFVPRAFAQFSSPLSGRNENDTNGKASYSQSSEIPTEPQEQTQLTLEGALIADDDTRPTVSTVTGSDVTITTIRNEDGSQYHIFDPAPRLFPWDQRHRRPATQKSTDQSLQRMTQRALNNPTELERGTVSRRARDTEHWLSDEAKARRRGFFMIIALLGIFPFIALLGVAGTLDSALSWHTRGEVDHFSSRQKRFLLAELLIILMATFAVAIFIAIKFSVQH